MYIVFLAPETSNTDTKKLYSDICEKIKDSKNTMYDGTFPHDTGAHEDHASQLTKEMAQVARSTKSSRASTRAR